MFELYELSKRLLVATDVDAVIRGLFDVVERAPAVCAVTFRSKNEVSGEFAPHACLGLDFEEWRAAVPRGNLSLAAIESKKPAEFSDFAAVARNPGFLEKHGLRYYLGVPLLARDRVLGVIGYYSRNSTGFHNADKARLTLAAEIASLGIGYALYYAPAAQKSPPSDQAPIYESAKAEFLNVMSHEFRTPLSLVMGHAGMMREGLLGEINDEQRTSLDRILENSDSLLAMVMSILQASRIEAGGIQLVSRRVMLFELFSELKALYEPQSNELRKIVWYCSPELELQSSDPDRLKDILRQLINNAVKFCPRGRIVVSAEMLPNRTLKLCVADTGVGIAPESLPFIFEKFRQSDSSGTRAFDGAGLGLYIAKKYTDLLGGELSVSSEAGKGSTFTLILPSRG